jgi:ribonuclease-3
MTEADRERMLRDVEARIGYRFRDPNRMIAALTHSSAVEASQPRSAERLEFLGDAVAGLVMSDLLIERYPEHNEGQLSKLRAALVNTASFAAKARELQLNESLMLGKGEEKTGGREKSSILAAVYEAVLGAIFLEGGYGEARYIVLRHFGAAIDRVGELETTDPKTELQELCQQHHRATPSYRVVDETGPDHARWFVVDVLLGDQVLARGEGGSKRRAEQDAAGRALQGGQLVRAGNG